MVRLTELDDAHLKSGEITEEQLGSANYDIWMCNQCQEVTKERYGAFFTSYSRCGACNYKTVKRTSQTLSAATHYSSGLAEVTEDCLHCGNHQTFTRTIPRLSQSSSSSFHSSGSGSSGSRSGGSSSGRGSSGSW